MFQTSKQKNTCLFYFYFTKRKTECCQPSILVRDEKRYCGLKWNCFDLGYSSRSHLRIINNNNKHLFSWCWRDEEQRYLRFKCKRERVKQQPNDKGQTFSDSRQAGILPRTFDPLPWLIGDRQDASLWHPCMMCDNIPNFFSATRVIWGLWKEKGLSHWVYETGGWLRFLKEVGMCRMNW